MALKIRLRRMGRKKSPSYRIVVAENTMPRDGRFVASIGHYNPRTEPVTLKVDRDKALFWLDQGAVPTDTTKSLLRRAGVFGPAPTVTDEVVETVRQTTGRARAAAENAAAAVAGAATQVGEAVADAATDAVEAVREAVGGESSEAAAGGEAAPAESETAETPADEEKAAPSAE